ncbi:MAG TPA: flagellar export chaperone FliS [Gemmatimonadaceae bacterium]|nr:flagellar export chaperone FliS [Gemmatimonadaceae bacterium]
MHATLRPQHTYQRQAQAYRESDVLSASPARLLIITFDGLLMAMTRFRVALSTKNDELSLTSVATARSALCELLATLDHEAGGSLADRLSSIYVFVLSELDTISHRPDLQRLDRNINIIRELRDAFAAAATVAAAPTAAA